MSSHEKKQNKPGKPQVAARDLASTRSAQRAAADHEAAATKPAVRPEIPADFPKPKKAYKNLDFLNSPAGRLIRIQCELTEPADRFQKHQVKNTIVMFGSARIPHPDRAAAELERIESEIASNGPLTRDQKVALDRARRLKRGARYYEEAARLARDLTQWSLDNIPNPRKRFYICSGGGPGIMEAANRGAHEAGGKSIALGISLPFEQNLNVYASEELGFDFHYFFVRKYWFLYLAKALVVFPGGFGTLDELFEMLTLIQTRKTQKYVPIVLYGKKFWDEVLNFQALLEWGVIAEEDLALFRFCDTVEEARDYLIDELSSYYL